MCVNNQHETINPVFSLSVQQEMHRALIRISEWPEGAQARIAQMALPSEQASQLNVNEQFKSMAAALARIAQWPVGAQSKLAESVLEKHPALRAFGSYI